MYGQLLIIQCQPFRSLLHQKSPPYRYKAKSHKAQSHKAQSCQTRNRKAKNCAKKNHKTKSHKENIQKKSTILLLNLLGDYVIIISDA